MMTHLIYIYIIIYTYNMLYVHVNVTLMLYAQKHIILLSLVVRVLYMFVK